VGDANVRNHSSSLPALAYSEKIRLALGLKGLSWRSVDVPVWTPRPKLTPMTGGYRRIPILQIGAEFYGDTLLILRLIDGLSSSNSLYPAGQEGMIKAFCWWIEKSSFMNAVCLTIGNVEGKLPNELIEERRPFFGVNLQS
jgi:glutathione S-transferase